SLLLHNYIRTLTHLLIPDQFLAKGRFTPFHHRLLCPACNHSPSGALPVPQQGNRAAMSRYITG
ncbi:MAG: hypothetical protein ACRCUH_04995, partial [Shewanella sp.]